MQVNTKTGSESVHLIWCRHVSLVTWSCSCYSVYPPQSTHPLHTHTAGQQTMSMMQFGNRNLAGDISTGGISHGLASAGVLDAVCYADV